MTLNELIDKDPTFNQTEFISKANLMIKKILNSITLNELDNVQHFMSEEVLQKIHRELEAAKNHDMKMIYDEVNVNCSMQDICDQGNFYLIKVSCLCKYLKYFISLKDGKIVDGNKNKEILATKTVLFQKKKNALPNNNAICPGCGKSLAINESGKCPYCGRIFNLDDYDYVIRKLDILEGE